MIKIIIYSFLIVVFLFVSAFCSSADMVYGSVNLLRISNFKENKKYNVVVNLINDYERTISSILFLNDLVNVGSETLAALLGYELFKYYSIGDADKGSLIGSAIILVVLIIFGEILPKTLSKNNSIKLSFKYASILYVLNKICLPIILVSKKVGNFIIKPFIKHNHDEIEVTSEELEEMVDQIEKEGIIDEDNADIIRGTIDFASTEAYEIMTPRVDLVAIDIDDDIEEFFNLEDAFTHSKIPVFKDTIDNIIGYVFINDLIRLKLKNNKIDLKTILNKPLRFPRSTEINDILNEFKKTKNHFAIINDEYGGIEGIVTMEDILEEIVGEIWDEEDKKDEEFKDIGDDEYIVDGSMNLIDFMDEFDIDEELVDTEYVTIGGYCIELLDDRFAKVNDIIHFNNLDLIVLSLDENNTIEKLKVIKKEITE